VEAENQAMAGHRVWFDAFIRRDWETVAAMVDADCVLDDRRSFFASRVQGRDEVLEWFRALASVGAEAAEVECVAMRGERLALTRAYTRVTDYEVLVLLLLEVSEAGLGGAVTVFEVDDLAAALVELDRRYLAGEGAPYASWLAPGLMTMIPSHNARDWDALAAGYAPGVVYVDHRPAGAGEIRGVEALLAYHRAFFDVAPSHRITARRMVVGAGRAILSEFVSTSDDTAMLGPSERVTHVVSVISPAGSVTRMEQFDEHDAEAARARLDELSETAPFDDNVAMDGGRRWFHAMVDGDWETATNMLRPDYVMEDRRPMFGTTFQGRDGMAGWMRETMAIGLTGVALEPIALRGDRLALCSRAWLSRDFEVTSLCLIETDDAGLAAWAALYDPDQLEEALDELEARFVAGEGGGE
jgi:hypothetical protein